MFISFLKILPRCFTEMWRWFATSLTSRFALMLFSIYSIAVVILMSFDFMVFLNFSLPTTITNSSNITEIAARWRMLEYMLFFSSVFSMSVSRWLFIFSFILYGWGFASFFVLQHKNLCFAHLWIPYWMWVIFFWSSRFQTLFYVLCLVGWL